MRSHPSLIVGSPTVRYIQYSTGRGKFLLSFLNTWGSLERFPSKGGKRVGENSMELLEQTIQHATEDIRDLNKRVERAEDNIGQLKSSVQLVQQSQTYIMENISDLKASFKQFNERWENKWQLEEEARKKQKEEELKRYQEEKAERAKELRSFAWKVVAGVLVAAIIVGFGLK